MKRILLKISGEALSSEKLAIDPVKVQGVAQMIQDVKGSGIELVIVLWGGNIYRGSKLISAGVDPADSHNMSMLSTVFNAVTLKNFLEKIGEKTVVMDALHVEFLEKYTAIKARDYISEWKIVITSSGGGTPFFTTDTTWVLRALELHCDAMIKLTQVDGVYDSDPKVNPDAKKFNTISYEEFISGNLKVLDQTGVIMARDNTLPIYVTRLWNTRAIIDLIEGKNIGTKIS
jgi:uridylate kinase